MLLQSWSLSNITQWELYHTDSLPDWAICTAVMWIALHDNKILLTQNHRWRELPGWHIEIWETNEEALAREMQEEWWVDITSYQLIGYRKIINLQTKTNKATWEPYPEIAYMPHYIVTIRSTVLSIPHGEEIIDCGRHAYDTDLVKGLHWHSLIQKII
jgi:8-oxo-dGTP pyrophosphatase MutT (NUDIX family)